MRIVCRVLLVTVLVFFMGCQTASRPASGEKRFDFSKDTFSFANETRWLYGTDAGTGKQVSSSKQETPSYSLHCFVVARGARQFFNHARFDSAAARVSEAGYQALARKVFARSPMTVSAMDRRVVIPGYASLREFSTDHEMMLKAEAGGAWHSYFQRGNWRTILPFTRHGQQSAARNLKAKLDSGAVAIVHVVWCDSRN